ncbi:3-hydroxyacyl-CoA dehydrogenase [Trypanosoma theileri]|uniref:3-hydroxyacyl-CoA dehydrogenase n=1 Tax=Trypanosoma theileri TaxID=67003 RepID=A0A1X0NM16_9TRYP|nr:3-hydroxyacyl-CoA dehydrogenase [Trypanosoma theileri]ORC85591.1 3-hydroxyacyl-CoA dehydrogenase [Trypanosoma theileri]
MRRLCPTPYVSGDGLWSPAVFRYVAARSQHPRGDVDGLLREINRLGARRGRGGHKLRVSASMLRSKQTSKEVMKKQDPLHEHSTRQKEVVRKLQNPVVIAEPPMYTDIACTLQELEGALFQLAKNESLETENQHINMQSKSIVKEKNNDDNDNKLSETSVELNEVVGEHLSEKSSQDQNTIKTAGSQDVLSCWSNTEETVVDPLEIDSVLHVTSLHNSIFTLELHKQPRSIRGIITLISQTLSKVESLTESTNSEITLMFRTVPNLPFFTPLQSELELTPLSRLELMMSKERLFQRMQEDALTRGISFKAELHGSALDFGAELFFFCNGSLASNLDTSSIKIGFPSIPLGVWPSPYVVKHVSFTMNLLENACIVIPTLHTLSWEKINKTYPKLIRGLQSTDHEISRIWDKVYLFSLESMKTIYSFFGFKSKYYPIKKKRGDFILDQWDVYCGVVKSTDKNNRINTISYSKDNECLELYATLLGTSEFLNTATVVNSLRRMHRRLLEPPPSPRLEEYVEMGLTDLNNGKKLNSFLVFPEGSSPAIVRLIAEQRASRGSSEIQTAMMFGDAEYMNEAVEMLDCAVIVTPLCPTKLISTCEGTIMEVHLRSTPMVSTEKRKEILSSALAYLQSKEIPYIVSKGDVGKRLVAALSMELCQLSLEVDMGIIEAIAKQYLGFRISPFQLMDYYDTSRLSRMLQQYTHMIEERQTVSAAFQLLSQMNVEGYGGDCSCHGGFYNRTGHLNRDVVSMSMRRKQITWNDVLIRLLAVLVNESSSILLEGCVETVQDINLISISALTLNPSTGGLLSCVDNYIEFATLVKCMLYMSRELGVISPPSPLLLAMFERGETFQTLSKETLLQLKQKT